MNKGSKSNIDEILTRGLGEYIDPDGAFKEKLEQKAAGQYKGDIIVKFGVDPTRPDIHLGHAVIFRKLRQLQELGCKVVFLVGDFTAQIGDPAGRSKVRPELSQAGIEANMKTYLDQVGKILKTDKKVFSWIRNSDWFIAITDLSVPNAVKYRDEKNGQEVTFPPESFYAKAAKYNESRMQVKDLGKSEVHNITLRTFLSVLRKITHGQLVQRDMFEERIKKGEELYMHEMIYPILQGVDSHVLSKIYGSCDLEVGGSDQTFNMLMGRTVMRMGEQPPQAVLSFKLLEGTDGKEKMSKSLENYIGITEPPHEIYGKAMSIPDTSLRNYFELCTYTPMEEVGHIEMQIKDGSLNPRDAKMRLAREIVEIYYGAQRAREAETQFVNTFSKKELPEEMTEIAAASGKLLAEALVEQKIVASKSEFRRLVKEGAVREFSEGEWHTLDDPDMAITGTQTFKIGKKRFVATRIM